MLATSLIVIVSAILADVPSPSYPSACVPCVSALESAG